MTERSGERKLDGVLVTGDITEDYNLYLPTSGEGPPPTGERTRFVASYGGAAIAFRVLEEISKLGGSKGATFHVGFAAGELKDPTSRHRIAAHWEPQAGGEFLPGKSQVWRLIRSIDLGEHSELPPLNEKPSFLTLDGKISPKILLIDDNCAMFRIGPPKCSWPDALTKSPTEGQWTILKVGSPICQGPLWWKLTHDEQRAKRLVIVLRVSDLRRDDVRISQGISWERTASDVANELLANPALPGLRSARHVIVTLHGEGAVWLERKDDLKWEGHLIFDPQHMEGEWSTKIAGEAYGYMSSFAAALAATMATSTDSDIGSAIERGVHAGLRANRLLRLLGHGLKTDNQPRLPFSELAQCIMGHDSTDAAPNINLHKLGRFGNAKLPILSPAHSKSDDENENHSARRSSPPSWRILEAVDGCPSRPADEPLYGVARRVALLGMKTLQNVPVARFGKVLTADRDEIEALNNVQRLIREYAQHKQPKPKLLSIAVFGPPGAGKSFGIKQIALSVDSKTPFLEFNLSQFHDNDLIGAFHQVRDKVLEGPMPVVFWDEFDSGEYKWLQFLLAPMQDGSFQEGQITHPIGKCVFVFAGGTSFDRENFGPRESDAEAWMKFKHSKGPDFMSRLHGFLNVLGPNQRKTCCYEETSKGEIAKWEDDRKDICFPVRRALLLRAMLGMMDEKRENERLDIDSGLLAGLLEVRTYTHGARSMEKVVECLQYGLPGTIRRSALPSNETLAMNLDFDEFNQLLERRRKFQEYALKLAPIIHEQWRENKHKEGKKGFEYDMPFAELSEEMQATNMAAALRIPHILELAGLYLVRQTESAQTPETIDGIKQLLNSLVDTLAEEEHILWMEFARANGWKPTNKPSDKRDKANLLHESLFPFSEINRGTQDYDRNQIRNYPLYADLAGFAIVATKPIEL